MASIALYDSTNFTKETNSALQILLSPSLGANSLRAEIGISVHELANLKSEAR
jgi:hypothetical protein